MDKMLWTSERSQDEQIQTYFSVASKATYILILIILYKFQTDTTPCVDQTSAEIIHPGNGDPFFEKRTYFILVFSSRSCIRQNCCSSGLNISRLVIKILGNYAHSNNSKAFAHVFL